MHYHHHFYLLRLGNFENINKCNRLVNVIPTKLEDNIIKAKVYISIFVSFFV